MSTKTRKLKKARARAERLQKSYSDLEQKHTKIKAQLQAKKDISEEWAYHVEAVRALFGKSTGMLDPMISHHTQPLNEICIGPGGPIGPDMKSELLIKRLHTIRSLLTQNKNDIDGTVQTCVHMVRNYDSKLEYCMTADQAELIMSSSDLNKHMVRRLLDYAVHNSQDTVRILGGLE